MKRTIFLSVLLSIGAVTVLYAQQDQSADATKTISARVVDADGQPVADILVRAFNAGTETFTDSQGNFLLDVLPGNDRLVIDEPGYKLKVVLLTADLSTLENITLQFDYRIEGENRVNLPYRTLTADRSVSAVSSISGEELASYPSGNLLQALAGRLPGVVVQPGSSMPGEESAFVSVRGQGASIYVDGIERNVYDLSAKEIDKVQVIKDMSGRAALGISGAGPVIWITTRQGRPNRNEMDISTEIGMNTPTILPEYLNAYDYARLYNEALVNDGSTPLYDQQALDAYQNNSNPAQYPNIDYFDRYVKDFSTYRHVNVNFSGVKDDVNYLGFVDYTGSSGLEKVGEQINSDRFKLRGNVNFPINDWIDMNVRVSGSYQQQRFPNVGSSAGIYNMFSQVLSVYPSNAHPVIYEGNYMISNDYPVNLNNELEYSGYGENAVLNSQNDAELHIDLDQYVEGLTFKGVASFNAYSLIGIGKGGTVALYRFLGDSLERVQEREVDPTMGLGNDFQTTNTAASAQLNYDRTFGKHAVTLDGIAYRAVQEGSEYQPEKLLDFSFRGNYAYNERYVVQFDLSYSGSMRLPAGERFNLYPSVGVAWVASNESFLQNIDVVNYLKFFASAGQMGINEFSLFGYNPFYLHRTTWQSAGGWLSGVVGSTGSSPITIIEQSANENIELPEKQYLNVGVQSRLLRDHLSLEVNYFEEKNTGLLSPQTNFTSALVGGGGFLPAVNFGEDKRWGVEGMLQFSNKVGEFSYSLGGNAMYVRGKYLTVDEPQALADYRKLAGKDMDLLWGYRAAGLYQDENDVTSRDVTQSWGEVQPGDIKYVDYNGDGVVDEQDIHPTGAHSPRLFYGINLSVGYKGFNLFVQGNGVADGTLELNNDRYFKITGTRQNYSKVMLDRWTPENSDNDYPRLTTSSDNNIQSSTFWHENAAYFRINNMELSYTLPGRITQPTLVNEVKIFVRGKNLFTSSDLSSKYSVDPTNINAGIISYPLYKTVTAGISVRL